MAANARTGTPAHLWIVGIASLLWNAMGCFDYFMTMTANPSWMSQFTAEQVAYWEGLPTWSDALWAIGVWGGLAGAVLLLMRSRHAVLAYVLSLIGSVISLGYQMFMTDMPASMTEGMLAIMPWVIIVVAALQVWYSHDQKKKGVLR